MLRVIYNAILLLLLLPISFLKLLKNANRNTSNIYSKRSIRKKKKERHITEEITPEITKENYFFKNSYLESNFFQNVE